MQQQEQQLALLDLDYSRLLLGLLQCKALRCISIYKWQLLSRFMPCFMTQQRTVKSLGKNQFHEKSALLLEEKNLTLVSRYSHEASDSSQESNSTAGNGTHQIKSHKEHRVKRRTHFTTLNETHFFR